MQGRAFAFHGAFSVSLASGTPLRFQIESRAYAVFPAMGLGYAAAAWIMRPCKPLASADALSFPEAAAVHC